ncbi:hypothetical protein Plhal304r1_c022g0076881 [Plasmopara halstedii]
MMSFAFFTIDEIKSASGARLLKRSTSCCNSSTGISFFGYSQQVRQKSHDILSC